MSFTAMTLLGLSRRADTAFLATRFLFGKLLGVAMPVGFDEKRCRKNLPFVGATRMRFKIEYAFEPRIGAVFAQRLDDEDFTLVDGATLGGIPVKPDLTMPRAVGADGNPRMDLFAFRPCVKTDVDRFVIGDIVELVIPDA